MAKKFRNILAFTLAQLVLFSTTSFAVDVHKCSGEIYDFSITGNVMSCEMTKMLCDLKLSSGNAVKSTSCCSEVHFVVNANTVKQEKGIQLNTSQISILGEFNDNYNKNVALHYKKETFYKDYSPPLIMDNINIRYQVFLI